MWIPDSNHPLRRVFSGLTEQTFEVDLGIADPPLIEYLATLLSRFLHHDAIYQLRDAFGRPLSEVADMLAEAANLPPEGRTYREFHRHIGDFTLFWTGVYPEALERLRTTFCKDRFINYCSQGKRAYYLASVCPNNDDSAESAVLRRLSEDFEICAYGLRQVRREWEERISE
jgi:hypothetical protein